MKKSEYQRLSQTIRREQTQGINQLYRSGTIAQLIADKSVNEDLLTDRQVMCALTGLAVSPCWFSTLKSSIKCHLMSKTF